MNAGVLEMVFVDGHQYDAKRGIVNRCGKQEEGVKNQTLFVLFFCRKPEERPSSDELQCYKFVSKGTITEIDPFFLLPIKLCYSYVLCIAVERVYGQSTAHWKKRPTRHQATGISVHRIVHVFINQPTQEILESASLKAS